MLAVQSLDHVLARRLNDLDGARFVRNTSHRPAIAVYLALESLLEAVRDGERVLFESTQQRRGSDGESRLRHVHDDAEVGMNDTRPRERAHCHVGVVAELLSLLHVIVVGADGMHRKVAVEDVVEGREDRLGIDHDDRLSELHRRLDLQHQVAPSRVGLVLGKVAETNDASVRLVEEVEREQQRHAALGIGRIEHHHVAEGGHVGILTVLQPIVQALAQRSNVRDDRRVARELDVRSVRLCVHRGEEHLHQGLERLGGDAVEVALQRPQQHRARELEALVVDQLRESSQIAQKVDKISQVEHILAVGLGEHAVVLDARECRAQAVDNGALLLGHVLCHLRVEAALRQGSQVLSGRLGLHHLQRAVGLGGVEQLVGENHGRHLRVVHLVVDDLERHRVLGRQARLVEEHRRAFGAAAGVIAAFEHELALDGRVVHGLDLGVGRLLGALVAERVEVVESLVQWPLRRWALHVVDRDRERQRLGAAGRSADHDRNLGVDADDRGEEVLHQGSRRSDADRNVGLIVESTQGRREHGMKVAEAIVAALGGGERRTHRVGELVAHAARSDLDRQAQKVRHADRQDERAPVEIRVHALVGLLLLHRLDAVERQVRHGTTGRRVAKIPEQLHGSHNVADADAHSEDVALAHKVVCHVNEGRESASLLGTTELDLELLQQCIHERALLLVSQVGKVEHQPLHRRMWRTHGEHGHVASDASLVHDALLRLQHLGIERRRDGRIHGRGEEQALGQAHAIERVVDQHLLDEAHDARGVELVDEYHDLDGANVGTSAVDEVLAIALELRRLRDNLAHSTLELLRREALVHQQSMEQLLEPNRQHLVHELHQLRERLDRTTTALGWLATVSNGTVQNALALSDCNCSQHGW